jgi:hypothetical protein
LGRFPGLVVFRKNRATTNPLKNSSFPLSGFRFPPEFSLASPSRPCRRGRRYRLLSWASPPFSTSGERGSTARGFAAPATFRLQGLITLLAVSSPRTRAGLVSCRQRSWAFALRSVPLPKGIQHVSAPDEPTYRSPCRYSLGRTLGQDRQAPASGLLPFRKSLAATGAINATAAGYSLGLRPLPGQSTEDLAHVSTRAPLPHLVAAAALTAAAPVPQSLNQPPARSLYVPGPATHKD